ncbi:FeoA family protein [Magnetococcus sp. PR-3]|uniref:FeoA family protein n=1 Tax=Magnetococcus sp. PR-3 TaxID=3120355 RepID=UPI002FCDED82
MTLADLQKGQNARIATLKGSDQERNRLIAMGLTSGKEVSLHHAAPFGDPRIYTIMGYDLSLRNREAKMIHIEPIPSR